MRAFRIVAAIVVLMVPFHAQAQFGNSGSSKPGVKTEQERAIEQKQQIIDDKAYKDSLSRIPDREKEKKAKPDPWGGVR